MTKRQAPPSVTFETVRQLCRALPGAEESTSYGTPAFKVKQKLFVRFHQDGESLVVATDFADRELLRTEQLETFFITDHYLEISLGTGAAGEDSRRSDL